jgi:MFS family permease
VTAAAGGAALPIAAVSGAFLLSLTSSFGQTFFIGLFGAEIRQALDLSEGGFGTLYSVATLASATLMVWIGAVIDRISARAYAVAAFLGLALAATGMALVTSAALLGLVLFGLRLTGQGMMGHASTIVAARSTERSRGKAMSIAVAGHPAGEALLPGLAVALIAWLEWRNVWLAVAGLMLVSAVVLPWLLPAGRPVRDTTEGQTQAGATISRWTVLSDRRFLGVLLALAAPPAIGTGIVFHQTSIAAANGWPLSLMAAGFVGYAIGSVVASFATGFLIDKLDVRRLYGWHLVAMGAAVGLLAVSGHWLVAFVLLAGIGVSAGASAIASTALFIAFYGTGSLGTVRALATSVMILSTATAPGIFGVLADLGMGWSMIAALSAGLTVLAIILARLTLVRAARAGG